MNSAHFESEIVFLDGVLNPTAIIKWDWEFTFFYAELGNIIFTPGVLEMNQLLLDIKTGESYALNFAIQITVLSFADVGASMEIEERNNGEDLFCAFELYTESEFLVCVVSGDALLDLVKIEDTDFGSFGVNCQPNVPDLVTFVEDTLNGMKEGFENALAGAEQALNEIGQWFENGLEK